MCRDSSFEVMSLDDSICVNNDGHNQCFHRAHTLTMVPKRNFARVMLPQSSDPSPAHAWCALPLLLSCVSSASPILCKVQVPLGLDRHCL